MQLEHMKARLLCWYILQRLALSKTNSTHLYVIGMSIIQCAESKRFALQVIRLDIVDALTPEFAPNVCFPLMLNFKQEALQ